MDPKSKKWSEMTDEEQQAAVALRLEKLDQARLKLENGVTQLVASGRWTDYLIFLSHFHRYSFKNLILIIFQNPEATLCASYRTWKKLGRHVRKGEKGIEILVPVLARVSACPESHHYDDEEDGRVAGPGPETDGDLGGEHTSGYRVVVRCNSGFSFHSYPFDDR